jgi:hypothetical protein
VKLVKGHVPVGRVEASIQISWVGKDNNGLFRPTKRNLFWNAKARSVACGMKVDKARIHNMKAAKGGAKIERFENRGFRHFDGCRRMNGLVRTC